MSGGAGEHADIQSKKDRVEYLSSALDFYVKIAAYSIVGLLLVAVVAVFIHLQSANEISLSPFHSPQDYSQKGLDGDVLAAHFLTQLASDDRAARATQSATFQPQAAQDRLQLSEHGDGISGIKVDIPHTGISLGSMDTVLRWLGKETIIDGELFEAPNGPTLVVRYGDYQSASYPAPGAADGVLPEGAAWEIYSRFQPALYANYWLQKGMNAPFLTLSLAEVANGNDHKAAAWAYWRLASLANTRLKSVSVGLRFLDKSVAADPDFALAYDDRATQDNLAGDSEGAFNDLKLALVKLSFYGQELKPNARRVRQQIDRIHLAEFEGDFAGALKLDGKDVGEDYFGYKGSVPVSEAIHQARLHDVNEARRLLAARGNYRDYGTWVALAWVAIAAEDWSEAEKDLAQASIVGRSSAGLPFYLHSVEADPLHAYVLAKLGRAQEANQLIGHPSPSCYLCWYEAGEIATEERRWADAESAFATATRLAPDLPFAYSGWGEMLLLRGDIRRAESRLQAARLCGPRFADSKETLAEAFLETGRYQEAFDAAKEAAREAPKWGRPYIASGKAMAGLGDEAAAQAEYARSRAMSLTPSDLAFFNQR